MLYPPLNYLGWKGIDFKLQTAYAFSDGYTLVINLHFAKSCSANPVKWIFIPQIPDFVYHQSCHNLFCKMLSS